MFSPLDDFMSARVLCPGFNARLRKGLGDRFFVGIPNRLGLTAWSTDFSRSRAFEKIVADEYAAYGHPLSPELFVSESGVLRTANFAERAAHGV